MTKFKCNTQRQLAVFDAPQSEITLIKRNLNMTSDIQLLQAIENQIQANEESIEYYITDYPIDVLVQKLETEFIIIPDYQRKNIWESSRKSRFIESVLMGLPIPLLFFWQNQQTGKLEVVDGAQRMQTLREFLNNQLTLKDLKRLDLLNGKKYSDLMDNRKSILNNKSIRAIVLSHKTDAASRIELFDRINTGSKIANPAEIRRGLLQGKFYELVEKMAENPLFNQLANISEAKKKEGEREELITRFFAYGDGLEGYKSNVSDFQFFYTQKMNQRFEQEPYLIQKYQQRFERIMQFFAEKYPTGFHYRGRVPRARFEGMAISVYLAEKERPNILNTITPDECQAIFESKEFQAIVRADGANSIKQLKARLYFAKDKLLESH